MQPTIANLGTGPTSQLFAYGWQSRPADEDKRQILLPLRTERDDGIGSGECLRMAMPICG
jgi:hypothetical protein